MSLRVHNNFHKTCKYCKVEYKVNQAVFMVRDRSFCCEDHRDLYMESQCEELQTYEMTKPKINNVMKKSPSTVSSNSLQDFFEVREKSSELCSCTIM